MFCLEVKSVYFYKFFLGKTSLVVLKKITLVVLSLIKNDKIWKLVRKKKLQAGFGYSFHCFVMEPFTLY